MSSIDTASAAIRRALEGARHLITGLSASKDQAVDLRDKLGALGIDNKATQLGSVADIIETAQALTTALSARLESALAAIEVAQGAARGPSASSSTNSTASPGSSLFKPMRSDPSKADEIRPHVGNTREAFGRQYGPDGVALGPVHVAGDDGPAADARDLKEPWASYARLRRHIEAHAAARMRQDGLRETALYINLPPCAYRDGCKLNVADLLPKGSKLWVHQVLASGGIRVHRFEGTGKGLKDDS